MTVDAQLLKDCRKGREKAQYSLYKLCFGQLMSVCMRYYKNEEDAVFVLNQGFMKILTNLDKYREEVPFEAWIKRIMINTVINEFHKNKKYNETILPTDFQEEADHFDHIEYDDINEKIDVEHLESYLEELPETTQKVFNLYAIDGYTHKEIGKMLNISDGTSKWHLSIARKQLKARISNAVNTVKAMII